MDELGNWDPDFDAVLLVEGPEGVQGRGLLRIVGGVGIAPLVSQKACVADISIVDGGLGGMAPPPSLRLNFVGSEAVGIAMVNLAETPSVAAGEEVAVAVQARDRYGNVSPELDAEVVIAISHGASGGGVVALTAGVGELLFRSEMAGDVVLAVSEVVGFRHLEEGSEELHIKVDPGPQAVVQLQQPSGPVPTVGQRAKLQVVVADEHGNQCESFEAMDLQVVAGGVGNTSVERGGHVSLVDGAGEVWVRSETALEGAHFWLSPDFSSGPLEFRHTEESPFEMRSKPAECVQLGLHLPDASPVPVLQPMAVQV